MGAGPSKQRKEKLGRDRLPQGLLLWYGFFWTWLAIEPLNRRDWLLENLLALTVVALLILSYRLFQFSRLSYCLIALFMTLHAVGAHYTYAEVPLGFWIKDLFALNRNPFDRIVHFSYGALIVYPMREWLMRLTGLNGVWASCLSVSTILALSGLFEVAETVVAVLVSPELGSTYLGTQGDEWDAQKDMASAFAGAILTMGVTLARPSHRSAHPKHVASLLDDVS